MLSFFLIPRTQHCNLSKFYLYFGMIAFNYRRSNYLHCYCEDFLCFIIDRQILKAPESSDSLSVKGIIPDIYISLHYELYYAINWNILCILYYSSCFSLLPVPQSKLARDTSLMGNCHVCTGSVQITGNIIHRVSQWNMNILGFFFNSL